MRPKSICCLSIPSSFHRVYYTPFFLCITALPWRAFRKLPYVSCDDSFGFPFIKRRTQHLGFNHQLCGLCSSGVGGKLIIIHNLCKLHVISLCVCVSVTSSGLRHLSCFFFQYKRRGYTGNERLLTVDVANRWRLNLTGRSWRLSSVASVLNKRNPREQR